MRPGSRCEFAGQLTQSSYRLCRKGAVVQSSRQIDLAWLTTVCALLVSYRIKITASILKYNFPRVLFANS